MRTLRVVPIITVDDIATARSAYTAVLGLVEVMDHGWICTLAEPGGRHQLSLMTTDATAPVSPQVSVEVDDVVEAYAIAQQQGLEIVYPLQDEEWGVRRFFFRDPGGTVTNVLSHR